MLPRRLTLTVVSITVGALVLSGCSATLTNPSTDTTVQTESAIATTTTSELWDSSTVHSIELSFDEAEYEAMIATYTQSGEKEWLAATVTIDGVTFENVGIRLKGNSSLRGISSDSEAQSLPWLIRLDKYVDGQNFGGTTDLVVRGNSSETSLNEAVALDLLAASGLASEEAVAATVTVNGETDVRLVIENLDDTWFDEAFAEGTALYKAEAGGDYSYRGTDPESYTDVFDQEAGDDDLTPLIAFLDFINNADDATFESDLSQWLDVDSFATYLAFQELVDNFDDIDGPGNNSYLAYDSSTGLMTVVSWDLNLAFGASPGGGAGGAGAPAGGGQRPGAGGAVGGGAPGGDAGGAGGPSTGNVLSERFLASDTFAALYQAELQRLTEVLYTSGLAQQSLETWTATLTASGVLSADVIASEASAIQAAFPV